MRITHITLTGLYTDKFTYQDNLLPKYHKRLGHDVSIIASRFMFNNAGDIKYDNREQYFNEYNIKVIRLNIVKCRSVTNRFKRYEKLYESIEETNPDVIFIHGCQFLDLKTVVKFKKKNPNTLLYLDNHADFSNSARSFLSKNLLHRIIWRYNISLALPYVEKFYGVLPSRVEFLTKMYNIPQNKVELLVLGADDDIINDVKKSNCKKEIRVKYNIKENDFLIVTGGKIDRAKLQTILLMKSIKNLERENIKLIVFGSVEKEIQSKIDSLVDDVNVMYIGWVSPKKSYDYFSAADLVVFPGRHSVFWEQVVGLGIPMIVKYWDGTTHVDVGGNCKFLYNDSVHEISKSILELVDNEEVYNKMKEVALRRGVEQFSYLAIAKRSVVR